jgi:hypothetical protein
MNKLCKTGKLIPGRHLNVIFLSDNRFRSNSFPGFVEHARDHGTYLNKPAGITGNCRGKPGGAALILCDGNGNRFRKPGTRLGCL